MISLNYDINLNICQSQNLMITPQLEYSLKILKIGTDELVEFIGEEMKENPLIEYTKDDSYQIDRYPIKNDYLGESSFGEDNSEPDYMSSLPDILSIKPSLQQYLTMQLRTLNINLETINIGEFIIENINANGYLSIEYEQISAILSISIDKVVEVVSLIKTFDPIGVCARNLKECLLLQVKSMLIEDVLITDIIENHLGDIAENKIPHIATVNAMEIEQVNDIIRFIKSLEPRPGSKFTCFKEINYIIPELIIKKKGNDFETIITTDRIPDININTYYLGALRSNQGTNNEDLNYIQNKYNHAKWLLRCIEQRNMTLKKVAESIVSSQKEFFLKGEKYLKPLTMSTIALDIDMHESTVSRAVNEKYLLCKWGVYELRYFFSNKIQKDQSDNVSSYNVKMMIKQIVDEEDKKNPLSDTHITKLLNEKGLKISRRTVAKYRVQMNIPTLHIRKVYV